jgi:hypothetical protein
VVNAQFSYNGTVLTLTMTDASTLKSFTTSWTVNIPATVGGNTAYAGFTAGTGGTTATQEVLTWTYSSAQAATPKFSPAPGTYPSSQSVTLSDATPGTTIYYTTDGSAATVSSPVYNAPIAVTTTATINAIAKASGYNNSAVATGVYVISRVIQYEAETVPSTGVPDNRIFNWSGFTDGVGIIMDATNVGNYIAFTLSVPQSGTYDVKFATKTYLTRGIGQLSISGINVGSPVDQYNASGGGVWKEFDVGNISLSSAGNYVFTFTVAGKNASSSGYTLAFDYIKLTSQ